MIKLSRKVEYGLIALKHMSKQPQGELSTAKNICELYKCPFDATSRVLQSLAQKGLLKSEQGAHGGYLVARDLSKVPFYDFLEMVVGSVGIAKCLHAHSTVKCELAGSCNIGSTMGYLNQRLIEFYKNLTLREVLDAKNGKCSKLDDGLVEDTTRQQWQVSVDEL